MAKVLYFDCLSGASGDMILASLVDLGVPVSFLDKQLRRLGIPGLGVGASKVNRNGIVCTQMDLRWKTPTEYRHLHDILSIIEKGRFSHAVEHRCEAVLTTIAGAEAAAHGIPADHVHFHEIGAVDTIIDIAGVCLAVEHLKVDGVLFSTLTEGYGTIRTEHGTMPVPAPATARIIKGFALKRLDVPTELLTPTGAALLTTLGRQSTTPPAGEMLGSGCGCGTKTFKNHPNYLRAMLIKTEEAATDGHGDSVRVLETDMDHVSGEIMGNAAGVLMEAGALDVSWTPIFMKKGRPGYRLTVICNPEKAGTLVDLIILHTRTLGVRMHAAERVIAEREGRQIRFCGGLVSEKKCRYKGTSFSKIENDDLVKIARQKKVPVIELAEQYQAGKKRK